MSKIDTPGCRISSRSYVRQYQDSCVGLTKAQAVRTSFNIPDEIVEEFDRVWQDEGLDNRSRAVREAMQEYIESHSRLEDLTGDVVTLVAFDYRHHDVIEPLHSVQHEYQDVILNTSHTHQGEWCLESLFCRGAVQRVRELSYRLRDFDGVHRVKIMVIRDSDNDAST